MPYIYPICLKRHVYNQCVLSLLFNGAETLTLTTSTIGKIQIVQQTMEGFMLEIIPKNVIRKRTEVLGAI